MDRRDEIEFLREAVRRRVEQTSIRQTAKEIGVSHGGIHNLVSRREVLYGKTLAKLRTWYLAQWAEGGEGLSISSARYLIAEMLGAIPHAMRPQAQVELLKALEALYRKHDVPPPAWLLDLRREWKEGSQSGLEPRNGAD